MKTASIFNDASVKRKKLRKGKVTTAMEIFDRDFLHPFEVDQIHFKMNNGTYKLPMPVSGNMKDQQQQMLSLIPTMGTIINMSDYYREGAVISIRDSNVALTVYQTILRHLGGHLHAMQTNRSYIPPQDNTLRELSEFATAIHYKASQSNIDLDNPSKPSSFFANVAASRPYINFSKTSAPVVKADAPLPKSITQMDAIERYLSTYGG